MNRPSLGRDPEVPAVGHKHAGRFRGYAVPADPRLTEKATKFRCRNCGQKVWVDAALAREVITCPTCKNQIRASHPGRFWLEMCGGVILFLSGFAIAHVPWANLRTAPPAPAAVLQDDGTKAPVKAESVPKPRWFASQADGN